MIQTFTPVSGMIVCTGGTGDYVKKSDYDSVVSELAECRQALESVCCGETIECMKCGKPKPCCCK